MSSDAPESKPEDSRVVSRFLVIAVDDSSEVLEMVTRYLGSKGIDVVTSPHGFDLASLLARRTPAAVVLDVMLPALAGSTLARIARKHAPSVPIVFYSAVPEDKGRVLASAVPGSLFVPKAAGLAALHRAISELSAARTSAARS